MQIICTFLCFVRLLMVHFIHVPRSYFTGTGAITQWASYQIRKIAGCACAGNAGNVFPHRRLQRKLLVSDPGMHHGTCVTHVPWCMSGSLTCSGGENVPGNPGVCAPAILCIWQEAHWSSPCEVALKIIHRNSLKLKIERKYNWSKTKQKSRGVFYVFEYWYCEHKHSIKGWCLICSSYMIPFC